MDRESSSSDEEEDRQNRMVKTRDQNLSPVRMRALYLWKEQQLGLFKLWNRTFVTESNSNSNSTVVNSVNSTLNSSSALFVDFKSAVLSQISFNKQMQQVLLSSHQFGNSSDLADNFTDPSLGSYATLDRCLKPCFVDDEHVNKLKSLGISMNKLEAAWVEDVKKPTKRTMQDVMGKFSSNDDVIAIGDVFFADVEQDFVMQPGGPLAHKCRTLIEPNRLIMLTAQRFIPTFGGEICCTSFPASRILKVLIELCVCLHADKALPLTYTSNDPFLCYAAENETSLLQSLVVLNGKVVPLVTRPARNLAEKWDALLYRHDLGDDPQVEAMLDKTICAMSTVFIGSSGSTFTEDILRLHFHIVMDTSAWVNCQILLQKMNKEMPEAPKR
ncbi:O-fucosyltransferase family protein [Actinidia rufa]|uniref:O-fucosyltransferase family protein n=1 Tax=Actinidia rufa TaxID=165716 RepID=A0A7J0GLT8_9ERIC|nr:O-fucosyltransferase family protein [Actinidia rufa]